MRRLVSLAAVAALLALLLPANVAAATRSSEETASIGCGIESELGLLSFFSQTHNLFGDFAEVAYWAPGADPSIEGPTLFGFGQEASSTATSFTTTVELFDQMTGEPAGVATIDAELAAVGDPEPFSDEFRDGNRWERISGVTTVYEVTGSADLEGIGTFDLSMGCFADSTAFVRVFNQPASHVSRFEETFISCGWEVGSAVVNVFVSIGDFGGFAEIFIVSEDGELGGGGDLTVDGGAFSATVDIFDFATEEPVGTAAVDGTFAVVGGRSRSTQSDGLYTQKIVSRALAVDGTTSFQVDGVTTELEMTPDACFGEARSVQSKFLGPKGPKATVLANDTPDGAIALAKLPAKVLTNTGLTSPEPEVPCLIEEEGETFELPFGSTAWWTFTGTGRDMTVNTARSSFDTALGIYWWDGAEFVSLVCVDDVFSEESFTYLASATIPTVRGETYHLQVGGWAGNVGRLQFTVR